MKGIVNLAIDFAAVGIRTTYFEMYSTFKVWFNNFHTKILNELERSISIGFQVNAHTIELSADCWLFSLSPSP